MSARPLDSFLGAGGTPQGRSIFFAVLVPMLLLILAEVLLFLGILAASGIVSRLNQNDCDDLDHEVSARSTQLQGYLSAMSSSVGALANSVNAQAAELVASGELDLGAIDAGASALLGAAVEPAVSALRAGGASGAFVVLNTEDLSSGQESGAYGARPGIYVCALNPAETPSVRNDDLSFVRAPGDVVRSHSITTDKAWKPQFEFTERVYPRENDYFFRPFQAAFEAQGAKDALKYSYWSVAPYLGSSDGERCVTFSMPLILDGTTVYGVAGAVIAIEHLNALLPFAELLSQDDGSYMIARCNDGQLNAAAGETIQVAPVTCVGFRPVENAQYGRQFSMVRGTGSEAAFRTVNGQYYISCENLRVYSSNAAFENEQWALLGIVPQSTLHRFSEQAIGMVGVATLFMLLLGFVGAILLGRAIANPLRKLSAEVAQAELEGSEAIKLSNTGINEVDQLTNAISTLSERVASTHRIEQKRLEYERDFDLLTGLMNRRAFYRRGEEIFEDPATVKNAAIVMLDLDNLKTLNDAFGHDCGDKYIRAAAQCFEASVPDHVLVSRISGDEFFLLFYGYDQREDIDADIEKLRQAIPKTEFELPDGQIIYINASGGVALYLEDSTEFSELMRLADFTMYQVKEAGKNNIAYFDFDTYQQKSSIMLAEAEFDELMSDFSLASYHFQPIFDAHTGAVFAYEALMHVSLGMLQGPMAVISLAQRKNRLIEIERMTWMRALECYEQLRNEGKVAEDAYLFINSIANLSLEEDELARISSAHSAVMANVVIEITEVADMDEHATAVKGAIPGFSGYFALDDYGSGYNSEIKLLTLRPKFVKIDVSIIRNVHLSVDKQNMISQVVEYAHSRDMLIVAEGVESAQEMTMLVSLGVDLLQGYYLARPAAVPPALSAAAARHVGA